jgi:RNA polymerase sigma-70 factor (ECF subfamily)
VKTNTHNVEDTADLRLLACGDTVALTRLIERWERRLFTFAWRYVQNVADAHDLVAQLFVRLFQHRSSFRADSNLAGWLFTSLANLCRNHHRWIRRHPAVSLESTAGQEMIAADQSGGMACPVAPPDAALEREETAAAVGRAIEKLPHDMKVAVLLHYYDNLSLRDIAAVVGCSERGVETRLYRARQQLRNELAGLGVP